MQSTTKSGRTLMPYKNILLVSLVSLLYLVISYWLIGYKSEQLVLVGLFNLMFYASGESRRLILGFSIFIVYWIIFDYMKVIPNYLFHDVDIEHIYHLEKSLFGIHSGVEVLTPNEYFLRHAHPALDIAAGIFYLTWVPVPLAFAVFLFFKNRQEFLYFSLTFLLVNILGFVVYYLHPAAPPWYVQQYGFAFNHATPGNTAGLARFDAITGTSIFHSIYAKSSNVFAAMPSLHSSYPVIVLFYAIRNKVKTMLPFFVVVMLGIWSAAVYSSHHYLLDVLAGITCALIGISLFLFIKERRWMSNFIAYMFKATSA